MITSDRLSSRKTVMQSNADDQFVMALALDPTDSTRGIVRRITERMGNPKMEGFIDKSALSFVSLKNDKWEVGKDVAIAGLDEAIREIIPEHLIFLGCEDPDITIDSSGNYHLFFTIPFIEPTWKECFIHIGHASGSSLDNLSFKGFALYSKEQGGYKEACMGPVLPDGKRFVFVEQINKADGYWPTTLGLATVPPDFNGSWSYNHSVAIPTQFKTKFTHFFSEFVPPEWNYSWCELYVSPCRILPKEFVDVGNGLLVGVLNGRGVSKPNGEFDKYRIGLFLFDPQTGNVPWVDPLPLIDDPEAGSVVFGSDISCDTDTSTATIYAHLDDSLVVSYSISAEEIFGRIPLLDSAHLIDLLPNKEHSV